MPALIGYHFGVPCCLVKGDSMRKGNDLIKFAVNYEDWFLVIADNREIIEWISDKKVGNQIF